MKKLDPDILKSVRGHEMDFPRASKILTKSVNLKTSLNHYPSDAFEEDMTYLGITLILIKSFWCAHACVNNYCRLKINKIKREIKVISL